MKAFFSQLWICIIGGGYPSAYVWNYWEYTWKNGEVVYRQWKTLFNYLTNNNFR